MDPLEKLADRWRREADVLRSYGAERLAAACEEHADQVEAASAARRLDAVTIQEAHEIGGYSYSHLQHLLADGTIENVGTKGDPRMRRSDVPIKPGHSRRGASSRSKAEIVEERVRESRRQEASA